MGWFVTYLVLLKEGTTDITVERIGEVMSQAVQSFFQLVGLVCVVNGQDEEVDEPGQRVLVHRVDVREVGDREEQNR